MFHKNCAVHFISTTFSINFVFSHFSVSIFLPRLLSLSVFFSLDAFLSRSGLFFHFLLLSIPLSHTVSFFPSLYHFSLAFFLSLSLSHSLTIRSSLFKMHSCFSQLFFTVRFYFGTSNFLSIWFIYGLCLIPFYPSNKCRWMQKLNWILLDRIEIFRLVVSICCLLCRLLRECFCEKKTVIFISASIKLDLIQCLFGCMTKWLTDEIV